MDILLPNIPPGINPWVYYLAVGAAVLLVGIAKGGFGGGIAILAIPLMSLVMGPGHMLGVLLPVLIAADILSNVHYLGEYEWRLLKWLLPGLVSGVVLGTLVLLLLIPEEGASSAAFANTIALIVGVVCLLVIGMQAYRLTGRELPTLPPHPASSWSVGMLAGGVSTLSHSAGPIVTIYLLQEKVPKRKLMGTILLYFFIGNTVKLPTFIGTGLINGQTLQDSIWFIPLLPIGTLFGAWLNKRVPEKPFAAIMYITAALAAGQMIYKAASPSEDLPDAAPTQPEIESVE